MMSPNNYNFDPSQMPSLCVIDPLGDEHILGDRENVYELASVTKLLSAITISDLVAGGFVNLIDQITTVELKYDEVYLFDLLSHTSGISFDGKDKQVQPRSKRVYSNKGFEIAGDFISEKLKPEFGDISIQELFEDGLKQVITKSTQSHIDFYGSPAYGARANLIALSELAREMREPTFIDEQMHSQMISIFLQNLKGIIPGWGSYKDCAFGVGYEIKSNKSPHWMGTMSSERSFGHFGQSGVFVMYDPDNNISIAAMGEKSFDKSLKKLWPSYVDEIYRNFI